MALLELGLQLREQQRDHPSVTRALERAAEAIESVIRDGDSSLNERGFYTILAAAAYHLGHFSARAFSLFPSQLEILNLSPAEQALTLLMLRDLDALRAALFTWSTRGGFDSDLSGRLQEAGDNLDLDAAIQLTLNSLFHRALAFFDYALESGEASAVRTALELLTEGGRVAGDFQAVPLWWTFTLAKHLLDDLWGESLHVRLPDPDVDDPPSRWKTLRTLFMASLQQRDRAEIDLWPSQLAAAQRALDMNDDLVVALPTSAGKTRIAELCILRTLSLQSRVIFVTPLRALSAQTERTLRLTFAPLGFSVSSLYGSSGVTGDDTDSLKNRDVVVTTPEKLDFALRNDPSLMDNVGLVVLDEAHTIGAAEREIRYEVLVQRLLRRPDSSTRRIVCLSAILPQGEELNDFVAWIRQDQEGSAISLGWRPTRQRFGEIVWAENRARLTFRVEQEAPFVDPFISARLPKGRRTPFPKDGQELTLASAWRLVNEGQTVLIYCPRRVSVNSLAKTALHLYDRRILPTLFNADPAIIQDAVNIGTEWLGKFHPAIQCLKFGLAVHHANLPRPFQRAVERLLRSQLLKVTIASPTLSQGLNLSATTVLFHSLTRGRNVIPGEEFANVAGRAGRAFVDVEGQVLCVAWEKKHLTKWNKLLKAAKERDLRSGLFQLVWEFCRQISIRRGYTPERTLEYVMGNAMLWKAPKPTWLGDAVEELKEQAVFERKWESDLACLDSALLSLVRHDAADAEVAKAIDDALQSSLWHRTLQREEDVVRQTAQALLIRRANFIWQNSTPGQRKGYFFAGVSFVTGQYLDEHALNLTRLLQQADAAFALSDLESAFGALTAFAEVIFAIEPFKPDELISDWKGVLRAWIHGQRMSDLVGGNNAETLEFIESALVYRLVWAMEAVRVRHTAVTGDEDAENKGRAALAVETGTPDFCAALLIQTGLPSRVAALKAVSDCPATFENLRGLRAWLKSTFVETKQHDPSWPTPETSSLWRDFVQGTKSLGLNPWSIYNVELPVEWKQPAPPPGTPVRVLRHPKTEQTDVYSIDLDYLGSITLKFLKPPVGIFLAKTTPSPVRISAQYIGPPDWVTDR